LFQKSGDIYYEHIVTDTDTVDANAFKADFRIFGFVHEESISIVQAAQQNRND